MKKISNVMTRSIIVNIFLSFLKITVGLISSSSALVADGFHSFSDLATDLVAIIGSKLSSKEEDEKHPYGHGKYEYLTSIVISMFILVLGFTILKKALLASVTKFSLLVIIVSLLTSLIKLILSRYILRKGYEYNSNILISSGKESSTDVISSLVVFISAIIMFFGRYNEIFLYADKIATLIVGVFILNIGYKILMENVSTLIGEQETEEEYINQISKIILENKNIKSIDKLVLTKYGSYYQLNAEVSMPEEITIKEGHKILDKIENRIKKQDTKIKYQNIHINPYKEK